MRRQAFDHLQVSFSFYDKKTGRLLTKVTKDLEQVGELARHIEDFVAVMTMIGAVSDHVLVKYDLLLLW
ncbi:hypothetical protein P4S72_15390 [Vibrio sp. PP-XX7]